MDVLAPKIDSRERERERKEEGEWERETFGFLSAGFIGYSVAASLQRWKNRLVGWTQSHFN